MVFERLTNETSTVVSSKSIIALNLTVKEKLNEVKVRTRKVYSK